MNTNFEWKDKFQGILNSCQSELKKTTAIGKKMLKASKCNSDLRESYEELGHLVYDVLEKKELEWSSEKVDTLKERIVNSLVELDDIEKEVNDLKFKRDQEK